MPNLDSFLAASVVGCNVSGSLASLVACIASVSLSSCCWCSDWCWRCWESCTNSPPAPPRLFPSTDTSSVLAWPPRKARTLHALRPRKARTMHALRPSLATPNRHFECRQRVARNFTGSECLGSKDARKDSRKETLMPSCASCALS